jgi:hypothetical protein
VLHERLCHGAPAGIAGTDKEDCLHDRISFPRGWMRMAFYLKSYTLEVNPQKYPFAENVTRF